MYSRVLYIYTTRLRVHPYSGYCTVYATGWIFNIIRTDYSTRAVRAARESQLASVLYSYMYYSVDGPILLPTYMYERRLWHVHIQVA